ncbi:glycosyltransferase family 4 protein [Mucilaginibacter jinjuensis]|uniref:Glycosyltransferase family 4 protein n=1 Tax=Mucilaginibacter jinjuensis TaxID=1176721 RepID=A0ABY7TC66_9SPHI|nr:glycosyltransferase family 4 protein [Mucilaginibacter jinjuensis]WCT13834.1 glycosyltransferase family 4 protein [Mucilaginibacter jinjuensis]
MKLVLSHLTGNANVKNAAYGFAKRGILSEYHVSLAAFPDSLLYSMGSVRMLSEIRRRLHDPILESCTKMWPWFELGRIISLKAGIKSLTQPPKSLFNIHSVVKNFDAHVASQLTRSVKNGANAVYGYEDTVLFTFRRAEQLGMRKLYDLPIGYWRSSIRLLEGEKDRWPDWVSTLGGLNESEEKLERKEEEIALADKIFVASTFTAKTLKDYPGKLPSYEVIPYGFPQVSREREYSNSINGPLKILFVGSLSQRKGIADLFAAVDNIGKAVELTIVGSKKHEDCAPLNLALSKHRWISSMSHEGVLELMRKHDVLVFPSLFEGFGLVITEAMSQGTPVITTDRTIGLDFIKDGNNGWLIQAGSTRALQDGIEKLLDDRKSIAEVGFKAMETARQRPWSVYSESIAEAVSLI